MGTALDRIRISHHGHSNFENPENRRKSESGIWIRIWIAESRFEVVRDDEGEDILS